MTEPNDSAFAHWAPGGQQFGLSKREYFAALALQGFLASSPDCTYQAIAFAAVDYADAVIAALNGKTING